jgi:hypothetical protein
MIRIYRGDEPDALANAREEHLSRVELRQRPPRADEFEDYQVNAKQLLARQFYKCGYCEMDVREAALPVEHYRPKGIATRVDWSGLSPVATIDALSHGDEQRFLRGLPPTNRDRVHWTDDDGYWWLAWTWENQVMSCGGCNTGLKTTRFPLQDGSPTLSGYEQPPGTEQPLLIDPTATDPMLHLVFEEQSDRWQVFPRNESPEGDWTIHVLHLNSPDLLGKYKRRVAELTSHAHALDAFIDTGASVAVISAEWRRLCDLVLAPEQPFLALTHDWLDATYPLAVRSTWRAPALQRPELCLHGVSRSPSRRLARPARPSLAPFSPEVQDFIRVARHHSAKKPRVDQLPLRALIAKIRAQAPTLSKAQVAALVDRKLQAIKRNW